MKGPNLTPVNTNSHPPNSEFSVLHSNMPGIMGPPWHAMNPMLAPQQQSTAFSSWPPVFPSQGFAVSGIQNNSQQALQPPLQNSLACLPPQLQQEVLRLSMAVQSLPENDEVLVKALQDSLVNGDSYKVAIEKMHGTNGHAANHWKDYYLEHKVRIDRLVSRPCQPQIKTAKKPTPSSFASSPTAAASDHAERGRSSPRAPPRHRGRSDHKPRHRPPKSSLPLLKSTKRSTINSLTAHPPMQNVRNLTPPHAEIRIPKPPSRSPTPPTRVVAATKGNKFTDEDVNFLHKFISYELKCNPDLTKLELAEKLEEKAPHHTAQSWLSYWSRHHDLPDKIYAAAIGDDHYEKERRRLDELDGYEDDDFGYDDFVYQSDTRSYSSDHNDSKSDSESSSESSSSADHDDAGTPFEAGTDSGSEDNGAGRKTSNDRSKMGKEGGPYTKADLRITASYIASVPGFYELNQRERWEPFAKKYNHRPYKSWAEYHRKNGEQIDKLARKYKRRQEREEPPIQAQRGRPSWAASNSTKRRLSTEDDDDDRGHGKRWKDDHDDDDED